MSADVLKFPDKCVVYSNEWVVNDKDAYVFCDKHWEEREAEFREKAWPLPPEIDLDDLLQALDAKPVEKREKGDK